MAGLSELQKTMNIRGKPHRLAWVNPKEEELLSVLGGSGKMRKGFPAYDTEEDEMDSAVDQMETEEDVEAAAEAEAIDWDDSASEGDSDWYAGTSDLDFYDKQGNLDLLAGLAGYDKGKLGKELGFEPYKDPTHAVDLVSTMERKGISNLQDLVGENVPEYDLPDFLEEWKNRPDRLTDPTTGEPLGYYDEKGDIAYKSVPAYFDAMRTGEHPTKHGGLWEMINTTFPWQKDLGQPWQAISKGLPTPIAALGQFFADIVGFKKEEPVEKKPEEALIQDKTSFVQPSIAQLKTQPGIRSEQIESDYGAHIPAVNQLTSKGSLVGPPTQAAMIVNSSSLGNKIALAAGSPTIQNKITGTPVGQNREAVALDIVRDAYRENIYTIEDIERLAQEALNQGIFKDTRTPDQKKHDENLEKGLINIQNRSVGVGQANPYNDKINISYESPYRKTIDKVEASARDREEKIERPTLKNILEKAKSVFEISPVQVADTAWKDTSWKNQTLVSEFGNQYYNNPKYVTKDSKGNLTNFKAYKDSLGIYTIKSLNINNDLVERLKKDGINKSLKDLRKEGATLPANLVNKYESERYNEARTRAKKELGPDHIAVGALTDMIFNMGATKVFNKDPKIGFHKTLKHMKEDKILEAANEMLISDWYKQTGKRAKDISDRLKAEYIASTQFKGGGQIDRGLGSLIYRQEGGDLKTILPPELEPEPEPEEEPITGTPMEQYFKRQATEPYWSIPPNRYTSELVGGLLGDENIKDTWHRLGWSPIQPPVTDPVPLPQPITDPIPLPQPGPIMPFGGTDPDGNKIKDYTDDEDSDPDPYSYYRKLPPPEPKEPGPKVSWDAEERELDDYKDLNYTDAMKKYKRDEDLWYDEYGRDFGTIGNPGDNYQGTQGPDGWPTGRPRRPPMKYEDYISINFPDDDDDDDDYVPILPPPRRRRRKKKRPELVLD